MGVQDGEVTIREMYRRPLLGVELLITSQALFCDWIL
jgi:hypothetical protein